jgi:hypothetical protein
MRLYHLDTMADHKPGAAKTQVFFPRAAKRLAGEDVF